MSRVRLETLFFMRILFQHPDPFFLAHGGFQTQIEQTRTALQAIGIDVEWLRWWDSHQRGDIIHFFGRPHPAHIQMARANGIRTVFSELLTSQGSRSSPRRAVQAALGGLARRFLPRVISEKAGWESYRLADAIIALTPWEAHLMEQLYGAPREKIHIVGNGVEEVFFLKPAGGDLKPEVEKNKWLVCVATITERKRVVELAEAAIKAKTPLWVIGKPYSESAPYFVRFLDTVAKSGGIVRYNGEISDRQELAGIYRAARGFVLLSSMESQSLSALEAAASGLPILLSDLPWARFTFGESAKYCPIRSETKTVKELRIFYDSTPAMPVPRTPPTWLDIAMELQTVYRAALEKY